MLIATEDNTNEASCLAPTMPVLGVANIEQETSQVEESTDSFADEGQLQDSSDNDSSGMASYKRTLLLRSMMQIVYRN